MYDRELVAAVEHLLEVVMNNSRYGTTPNGLNRDIQDQ